MLPPKGDADKERQRKTRRELLDILLKDQTQAASFTKIAWKPTAYEISDALDKMIEEESSFPIYQNETYSVIVRDCPVFSDSWPEMVWLSIRRAGPSAADGFDWREMQEIKNQLVGEGERRRWGMFPAESRLVDTANSRHMFCLHRREDSFAVRLCGAVSHRRYHINRQAATAGGSNMTVDWQMPDLSRPCEIHGRTVRYTGDPPRICVGNDDLRASDAR